MHPQTICMCRCQKVTSWRERHTCRNTARPEAVDHLTSGHIVRPYDRIHRCGDKPSRVGGECLRNRYFSVHIQHVERTVKRTISSIGRLGPANSLTIRLVSISTSRTTISSHTSASSPLSRCSSIAVIFAGIFMVCSSCVVWKS